MSEGWGRGRSGAIVQAHIAASEAAGLDCLSQGYPGVPLANTTSHAHLGYLVYDEPSVQDFAALASWTAEVRRRRPGKLRFVNLLPNYCADAGLGNVSYATYLSRFVAEVRPDLL